MEQKAAGGASGRLGPASPSVETFVPGAFGRRLS